MIKKFQNRELIRLTYTNLTQFEWTKMELNRIFYEQNKNNGNSINTGKRNLIQTDKNTLLENENVNQKIRKGRRVDYSHPGGLFSKITPEGVSSVLVRRISIGWLKSRRGEIRPTASPEQEPDTAAPWPEEPSSVALMVSTTQSLPGRKKCTGRKRSLPRARLSTFLRPRTRVWSSRWRREELCSARSQNARKRRLGHGLAI